MDNFVGKEIKKMRRKGRNRNSQKRIYAVSFISGFIESFPLYWNFFKGNYGSIILIISFLGSLNQILTFIKISPSLIVYFSPKQAILDGVVFLMYSIMIILFVWGTIFLFFAVGFRNKLRRFLTSITLFLLLSGSIYVCFFLSLYLVALIFFVPFFICFVFLFFDEEAFDEKQNKYYKLAMRKPTCEDDLTVQGGLSKEEFGREKNKIKRVNYAFLIMFANICFYSYSSLSLYFNSLSVHFIVNYELIAKSLEEKKITGFKIVYSNGDYLFLENKINNQCIIVPMDVVTKNVIK